MPGRGSLHDQPPVKTLGAESLGVFHAHCISRHTCCTTWLEELRPSCVSPRGEDPGSLPGVSSGFSPGFALCPLAVMHHSGDYN